MKITNLRTAMVDLPYKNWIVAPDIRTFGCVLVFLDTDEGITGESFLWSFGTRYTAMLNAMILSLKEVVLGEDPRYTERLWRKLWAELRFFSDRGVSMMGLSTIDRACWDAVGKAAGKPLYLLLGACRDEAPAYASALWMQESIDELVEEAGNFVAEGYGAIKMRIGKPRIEEDIERVRAVREAVGPDVKLMVDANQRLTVKHAIKLGRKIETFDIAWFEEPVPVNDLEASAQVAAALNIPLANGENFYTRYGFRHALEMKAADILMPDLMCVGGVTEFMKVAHLAEAHEVPITPHIFPEESMHMVAAIQNGTYVENMAWFSPLYKEKVQLQKGMVVLPQRPGFGFTFDPEIIERHRFAG